jgi:hypothetical protein
MTMRHPIIFGRALLGAALAAALAIVGCNRPAPSAAPQGGVQNAAAPTGPSAAAANPCGQFSNPPVLKPNIPMEVAHNQAAIDCAAWQTFIALNWQADPAKPGYPNPAAAPQSFGTPGDVSAKVWESYLDASTVFGTKPIEGLWVAKRPTVRRLDQTSKFASLDLTAIDQAGRGDHWLTSQRGEITYYEVMMNQDEYEFITQKNFDLTSSDGQKRCASQPGVKINNIMRGGLSMPSGARDGWVDTDCTGAVRRFGQGVGAIEIKASWTPLPADGSLNYRYKTAQAQILDPVHHSWRSVTVGLVGLHILRKRPDFQQWTWMTFEQIDNAPDEAANGGFAKPVLPPNPNLRPAAGFTFFNTACDPAKDPTYGCRHNAPPTPCGTSGSKCDPFDKPMQITRLVPVDATANAVTGYVWGLLPAKSVYNYYRLVNVLWPQKVTILPAGTRTPLTPGNFAPADKGPNGANQIVANVTLESFQQASNSCMDCHQFASIASAPQKGVGLGGRPMRTVLRTAQGALQPYGGDYSFIFLAETKR